VSPKAVLLKSPTSSISVRHPFSSGYKIGTSAYVLIHLLLGLRLKDLQYKQELVPFIHYVTFSIG